jgi:hypothetical protein
MRNESFPARLSVLSLALMIGVSASSVLAPGAAMAKSKPEAKAAPAAEPDKGKAEKSKADAAKDSGKDSGKDAGKDAGKAEQLGSYGDWSAYTAASGKDKTCYALGQPKDRQPKAKLKDTTAYIFITTRPGENIRNEIAINLGYATKDGSSAAAEIDGDAFELITKGQNAWVKEQPKEKEFVGALRGGSKLVIKASSAKGTATVDTYSLKGLSDALARVAQECK